MSVFQSQLARHQLLSSVAIISVVIATPAMAQSKSFNIPSMPVKDAAAQVARTAQVQVLVTDRAAKGRKSNRLVGDYTVEQAFQEMLKDTGLTYTQSGPQTFVIKAEAARPSVAAPMMFAPTVTAAVQSAPQYDEIIVTAQRKEEKIIDVPIAMTALSAKALDDYKIEGGSELLRAVPNVNFSKSNFSMYNFSIRGIGTKAISASSDPAVAVSFNNAPLVRNRLFESEFFDMQRIEVLRGPQGTLYGRNATAGVVNLITALPISEFDGNIKAEIGNYQTRRMSGMLNIPLSENLNLRIAGSLTKRSGYDLNLFSGKKVNGRDLWSTRATLAWEPHDDWSFNVIWQRFQEDDDRSRTGKQLCHRDPGPERVGNVQITNLDTRGRLSQGCLAKSLYDDGAFGVPNGRALSYTFAAATYVNLGLVPGQAIAHGAIRSTDPFDSVTQSKNLREVSTSYDPIFKAKNDIIQFNVRNTSLSDMEININATYSNDYYFSSQDYNRFLSNELFYDSKSSYNNIFGQPINTNIYPGPTPGGVYCDYQLGCSTRMVSADLSKSQNKQWQAEARVSSNFDTKFNFSVGVNYLDFRTLDRYYVFNNIFSLLSEYLYGRNVAEQPVDFTLLRSTLKYCPENYELVECVHVEKNTIDNLKDMGHNYFLSKNPVKIKSYAVFSELYYKFNDDIKITVGGRATVDRKDSDRIPSQLLLGGGTDGVPASVGGSTGGKINSGHPSTGRILQKWTGFTGRFVLDWRPRFDFTDDSLLYASYSRGYKGGGTNPPRVDINQSIVQYLPLPEVFNPEYVNAFEIGSKNSLLNNKMILNATAFYYDYTDYQISQIIDRISYNENFDASSMGLEFETSYQPNRNIKIFGNLGILKTKLKGNPLSVDVMNRTQGNPDWVLLRPWIQAPSNCIAPRAFVERILVAGGSSTALAALCLGSNRFGSFNPNYPGQVAYYNTYNFTYDPLALYDPSTVGMSGGSGAPNGGRGFYAPIKGNELPNSPRYTINVGAEYTTFFDSGKWSMTARVDYYKQSKSFARIYNTEYDRLRSWDNMNLSFDLFSSVDKLRAQVYVKNVFSNASITDFFTNADDAGLSANVFTLDPRIYGLSVSKQF